MYKVLNLYLTKKKMKKNEKKCQQITLLSMRHNFKNISNFFELFSCVLVETFS